MYRSPAVDCNAPTIDLAGFIKRSLTIPTSILLSPAEVAEINAWHDAKEQPLSDAELDALERRAELADALDGMEAGSL